MNEERTEEFSTNRETTTLSEKKWYHDVTLEDAETFILANMKTAVRSVIAVGYYLKCIRDGKLYLEAGYESIWEYAEGKYGFSKSTASRYMARNDKFSVDGNSPILAEEYREYSKAQLQEMLSLDDGQLEQVTPDMTVKQIRELKKPAVKEIPYYEIPGQTSFSFSTSDLMGISEEEENTIGEITVAPQPCKDTYTVSPQDFFPDTAPEPVQQEEPEKLSAYGTPRRVYPPDSLIATPGCMSGTGRGFSCFGCHMECEIRGEICYCVEAPMGNPFPCEIVGNGTVEQLEKSIGHRCQFVNLDLAYHTAGTGEPVPCCKECPDPCEYACKRSRKAVATPQQEEGTEGAARTQQNEEERCDNSSEQDNAAEDVETNPNQEEKPVSDLDLLKDVLEREKQLLNSGLGIPGIDVNDIHIRKMKLKVAALASMVCDMEGMTQDPDELDQPELPDMKNNDQRKTWLRDYQSWGIWYIDEHIGCRYYKYDFDNGARLIVEEYDRYNEYTKNTYLSSHYHLVGGPEPPKHPSGGYGKWTRHDKYDRYPNSETELVEFLKEVQK